MHLVNCVNLSGDYLTAQCNAQQFFILVTECTCATRKLEKHEVDCVETTTLILYWNGYSQEY
jgi:hypothetical protein